MSGRGESIQVTMIPPGVEISIAGGVAETKDGLTTVTFFLFIFFSFFFLFFFFSFFLFFFFSFFQIICSLFLEYKK